LHKKLGQSIPLKAKTKLTFRHVARNSSWEGANAGLWGSSPQLPEANGGLGRSSQIPEAGVCPQPPEARRSGGEPPALGDFYDFSAKITHF